MRVLKLEKHLTYSLEDYVEIIYMIQQRGELVRITDIANALGFSKASVNRAVNTLKSEDIVIQEKYGKIHLTEKGFKIAKEIYERHKILSKFFREILGVKSDTAELDACRAEHVLSAETLMSIEKFLNKTEVLK